MKVFRRIISILSLVCIIISSLGITAAADKGDGNKYIAKVTLGSEVVLMGILDAQMGTNTAITIKSHNGREGWFLDSSKGTASSYIGVNLDSSLISGNEDGSQYEVEVDYFDSEKSIFGLVYDAIDKPDKETDLVYLGTQNEWKTHTFVLDDAYFSDRLDGEFDFKIAIRTKKIKADYGSVTIGAVRVKKHTAKNPVQVISAVSKELGNIFANGEAKNFTVSFRSYSKKPENVTVTYKAIDEALSVKWQKSDGFTIQPKSEAETSVEIDVNRYSLYHLVVEVSGEDFHHTKSVPFSFVNSTEDGSRNDHFGYNVHFQWAGYDAFDGVEVIKKSNAGFVRNTPEWLQFEPVNTPKGELIFPDYFAYIVEAYKQAGLKLQVLMAYGNTKYGNATHMALPETDEQIQAYANYCAYVAKALKERGVEVNSYEIWNEPNLTKFGGPNASPDIYFKVAKEAAIALRKADPDAKIGGLAVTNVFTDNIFNNWYKKYLEMDLDKYFDALTLHPYDLSNLPETRLVSRIKEYKDLYEEKYADSPDAKPFALYQTEHGYRVNEGQTPTEKAQADNVVRSYILLKAAHVNDLYTLYVFSNSGGIESNLSQTLGSVRSCKPEDTEVPYSAKSLFLSVANMNKQLQNAECTQTLLETDSDYAYVFKRPKDNKNIITFWTTKDPKPITFSLNTDKAVLYDTYGNAQVIKGNNGIFTFTASNSVSYVEGFSEAGLAKPVISTDCYDYRVATSDELEMKFYNESGKTYSIEVEASDNVTPMIIPEKIDDSAVITVKAPSVLNTDAKVRVRFIQDSETVQCLDIYIKTTERIAVSVYTYPTDRSSINRWTGAMHITNYSTSIPLSGYLTILSPREIADKMGKIRIPTIPHGATGVVSLKFPELRRLSMYKLKCLIETDGGEVSEFVSDVDFSVALYAESPPIIDGESNNEWVKHSALIKESFDQVYMSQGYSYNGIQDLSARTYVMYDEDNFYMYTEVQDDIHYASETGSGIWKNDSIQFGLVFEQRVHDHVAGGTFSLFALSDTPSGPIVWRHMSEGNELAISEVKTAELAIKRKEGYTYYELRLPWSEVKVNKPDFNQINEIGFSMLVNDNDGNGRKGWIAYADGIGKTKDTSLFTFLKIIKK